MLRYLLVGIMVVSVWGHPNRQRRFDGEKVFKILPNSLDDVKKILDLAKKYDVDIWKAPKTLNMTFDIRVHPDTAASFIKDIENMGIEARVWIKNLQKLVDEEKAHVSHDRHRRASSLFDHHHYHRSSTINKYLESLRGKANVQVLSMGRTYENRDMKYVKISTGGTKKAIYIDGGIHAREWLSISTVLYVIDQLANNPSGDRTITALLNKFDFYLMPVVNVDGYEYSIDHDRMWRKNRRPNSGFSFSHSCDGVDLNRNFDYHWNPDNGGSRDPCDSIYAGTTPSSEPETQSVSKFLDSHRNIIAYLNVHTYGQYWIYPWGYTSRLPTDWHDLDHLGRVAASAIYKTHQNSFTVGEDTRELYAAAGGADDYAKGHAGVKYAYTVELGDTGRHGFVMPSSSIIPAGEETWNGIKAFAMELISQEHL